jgi:tRNA wybutosine-synthesizing protein 2
LKRKFTVWPGATVGVTNPFRIALAYPGLPGSDMSPAACADDIAKDDRTSARTNEPRLIAGQKPETDYKLFWSSVRAPRPGNVIILATVANRVLGARVERRMAEKLRKALAAIGAVDTTRLIIDDGPSVVLPLAIAPSEEILSSYGATLVESAFPPRLIQKDPIDQVLEIVRLPEVLKPALPRKWERFGDVLVLRLDTSLDRYEAPVAEAYSKVLGTKTVLRDVGGIAGDLRQPVVRKILGSDTVTTHTENGVKFRFDAAELMFSSGNTDERARMAQLKCDGETIVDMFAGIGYFSLPIAVHQRPARVIACELNPVAHSYLVQNITLNKVDGIVEPVLGDNRDLGGESIADRVIMGYVRTTHEFLPTAIRLVKDGGVLHYHETCPNDLLPERPVKHIKDGAKGCRVVVEQYKQVKSYAPGVGHIVVDARIFKSS